MIKVEQVSNGFILTTSYADNDDIKEVVEEDDDEYAAAATLLYKVAEAMGPSSSKYDAKRIRVVCLPGDSFEGTLDTDYANELKELAVDALYHLPAEAIEEVKERIKNYSC